MTQKTSFNELRKSLIYLKKTISHPKKTFNIPKKREGKDKHPFLRKNIFDIIKEDHAKDSLQNQKLAALQTSPPIEHDKVLTEGTANLRSQLIQAKEVLCQVIDSIHSECKNGIATITLTITSNDPDSIFSSSDIILEHYDTAPHCFNIQFSGSLDAVNVFNTHLQSFQTHLDQRLAGIQVQLLTPILKKTGNAKSVERRKNVQKKKMGNQKKNLSKL